MILFHPRFKKQYHKFSKKIRGKIDFSLSLFEENPFNAHLHNHALHGKWSGYRSIDITGDVRALYAQTEEDTIFVYVGTHSQLYG